MSLKIKYTCVDGNDPVVDGDLIRVTAPWQLTVRTEGTRLDTGLTFDRAMMVFVSPGLRARGIELAGGAFVIPAGAPIVVGLRATGTFDEMLEQDESMLIVVPMPEFKLTER